jgi:crotonobetainyl-CoA:carnitine CoA-transferase CaiB-like acyl-CoA transferase
VTPVPGETQVTTASGAGTASAGALAGVRVLELARTLAGPFAGHVLADLGADVLKVEQPGSGDESRRFTPPTYAGDSCYFQAVNRNKRSIALDLKDPADREVLLRLVENADVVTESFRTGVTQRLGVDYETLRQVNPRLIYLSVSGYGREGSRATWPAYDIVMQAETGLMSMTGTEAGEVVKIGPSIADISTGMYSSIGLLTALYLDVAMFDAQFGVMNNWALSVLGTGEAPRPMGVGNPALSPYQTIATADGDYMLGCGNDGHWRRFCEAMGYQDLLADERFTTNDDRVAHRGVLIAAIEERTRELTRAQLDAVLKDAGVPGSPVNDLQQVLEDPFAAERGILQPLTGREDVQAVKFPVTFGGTPVTEYRPAPALGADEPQWQER